jgi:hypothetical protein
MPCDGSLSLKEPLHWAGLDTWTCITILLGATGMVAIGYLQSSKSCGSNTAWDLWEHQNGVAHDKTDGLTVDLLQQEVQHEFQKFSIYLPAGLGKRTVHQ